MRLKLITLLSLLLSSVCFGEQRLAVKEGERVTASISGLGLNRIAVENDRILSVKSIAGQFQMDKDTKLGQIFIHPTIRDKSEPIHLFITTEKGATYGLSLLVSDSLPKSIVLTPDSENKKKSEGDEKIGQVLKAMHNTVTSKDFAEAVNKRAKEVKKPNIKNLDRDHG